MKVRTAIAVRQQAFFVPQAAAPRFFGGRHIHSPHPLFVYGTLRRDQKNFAENIPHGTPVEGGARVTGNLFLFEGRPVMIPRSILELLGSQSRGVEAAYVHGDLILLPDTRDSVKLLRRLDALEGVRVRTGEPDRYERIEVEVLRPDGSVIPAWTYVATLDQLPDVVARGVHIPHGDWARYRRENEGAGPSVLDAWERTLLERKEVLRRSSDFPLDQRIDKPRMAEIHSALQSGDFRTAEQFLFQALRAGYSGRQLQESLIAWLEGVLIDADFQIAYDRFDYGIIPRSLQLIAYATKKVHFSKRRFEKIVERLDALERLTGKNGEERGHLLEIWATLAAKMTSHQELLRQKYESWTEEFRGTPPLLPRVYQGLIHARVYAAVALGDETIHSQMSEFLVDRACDWRNSPAVAQRIFEDLLFFSRRLNSRARRHLALSIAAQLHKLSSPIRLLAARAYLELIGAAQMMSLLPVLMGSDTPEIERFRTMAEQPRRVRHAVYADLLKSPDLHLFSVGTHAIAAAGYEAVRLARQEMTVPPRLERIVLLEAALLAGRGKSPRHIARRVAHVLCYHRNRSAHVFHRAGILGRRIGFEIEWWPEKFAKKGEEDKSDRLHTALSSFGLLTATDGYGEFASMNTRTIEAQAHKIALLRALGLLPNHFAYSLHLNFGLPFAVPFYEVASPGTVDPKPTVHHPELYAALFRIWFPLGLFHSSDARWDNMTGKGEVQSIRHPFRFHSENVMAGDASRLEYRIFEVDCAWKYYHFLHLAESLHHLTTALFWYELSYMFPDSPKVKELQTLGRIWAAYIRKVDEFSAAHGLHVPNYFEESAESVHQQSAFQEALKALRAESPDTVQKLRRHVDRTVRSIAQIIQYTPDARLRLPKPILANPSEGII